MTMQTVTTLTELREAVAAARKSGRRIGFVPTMGNLHEGHLRLIDAVRAEADFIVASIFVNPLQFGANEDLDSYPRTLAEDQRLLAARGCDLLFAPTVEEMYPDGQQSQTRVSVPGVSERHCGASRPGHFEGVATVVSKLFNMVQPDVAAFGKKDYQQLAVIRKLVRDLCFPIRILGVETARAEDGLALSSRNGYLGEEERRIAPELYRTLNRIAEALKNGERDFAALEEQANRMLEGAGFSRDYFHICNARTLEPASPADRELVILAAARLGRTRLIDNLEVRL